MPVNKHFRYGHILYVNEVKFAVRIPMMVCDPENQLEADQHVFITPHKKVFDGLKPYTENVILADVSNPGSADVVNKYAECCDWLIVHGMPQPHRALAIKKKYCKKIVWRTWGHDVGYKHQEGQLLKNTVRTMFEFFWKQRVRQFRAVGIANVADKIALTKKFGKLKLYPIPYTQRGYQNDLEQAKEAMRKDGNTTHILVGHSGTPSDHHIEILKRLEAFKNEDIHLTFILSYGDPEHTYIDKLIRVINDKWSEKSTIVTEMMSLGDYLKLLSKMDIVFLDGLHSNALGNISTLLYFGKKIFLNRNGILRQAFDLEKVPYCCSDEVENMSFEAFIKPVVYQGTEKSLMASTYEEYVGKWRKLLDDLKAEGEAR